MSINKNDNKVYVLFVVYLNDYGDGNGNGDGDENEYYNEYTFIDLFYSIDSAKTYAYKDYACTYYPNLTEEELNKNNMYKIIMKIGKREEFPLLTVNINNIGFVHYLIEEMEPKE